MGIDDSVDFLSFRVLKDKTGALNWAWKSASFRELQLSNTRENSDMTDSTSTFSSFIFR